MKSHAQAGPCYTEFVYRGYGRFWLLNSRWPSSQRTHAWLHAAQPITPPGLDPKRAPALIAAVPGRRGKAVIARAGLESKTPPNAVRAHDRAVRNSYTFRKTEREGSAGPDPGVRRLARRGLAITHGTCTAHR